MWVSVRTRRLSVSPRLRKRIEQKVKTILAREDARIASAVVYVEPARMGRDDIDYAARVALWSSALGQITVNDVGPTVSAAVSKAVRRARYVVRQQAKRQVNYSRLARHFRALDATLQDSDSLQG